MWGIKKPTHYSKRLGHEVPGAMAVFCECMGGYFSSCQNLNLLKQINNKKKQDKSHQISQ